MSEGGAGGGAPRAALRLDHALGRLLPLVLCLLLVYLYVKLFTDVSHVSVSALEYGLVIYFVGELATKRWLAEGWRDFFVRHWLKIVLVLPFLRSFRLVAELGIAGRSIPSWARALPYAQKLSKVPLLLKKVKPALLVLRAYLSVRERRRKRGGSPAQGGESQDEAGVRGEEAPDAFVEAPPAKDRAEPE